MVLLFLNMGEGEITLIVLVIILFFGSKSIPTLARGLGKGIREFKDATQGIQREIENSAREATQEAQKVTLQGTQTATNTGSQKVTEQEAPKSKEQEPGKLKEEEKPSV